MQALNQLCTEDVFSICTVTYILDILGVSHSSAACKLLRALHCIKYNSMSEEVREAIPRLLNEAMRPPSQAVATSILDGVEF